MGITYWIPERVALMDHLESVVEQRRTFSIILGTVGCPGKGWDPVTHRYAVPSIELMCNGIARRGNGA